MSAPQLLMDAFDYTEADLDSNRRGVVTPAQLKRLRNTGRSISTASSRTPWVVGGFVVFGVCLMSAVYMYYSAGNFLATITNPSNLLACLFAGLLIVGIVAFAMFQSRRTALAFASSSPAILKAEGRVDVRKVTYVSRGIIHSYFAVTFGDKTFKWLEETANLFQNGAMYCVYYFKTGPYEQVLSIDRLDA